MRTNYLIPLTLSLTAAAHAQYIPPTPGKATNIGQNQLLGGQRSDLEFDLKNVQFQTEPCAEGSDVGEVLLSCTFDVELKWKSAFGWLQVEGPGDENGPETLTLLYEGSGRWHLESVTRAGSSVFGGAVPEGEEGAGPNGGGGVKITPPESFETSANTLKYSFTFSYAAHGDECEPFPLRVRGSYSHTYDGPWHLHVSDEVTIGISGSYPWGASVSVGGSATFANDAMWSKEMIDPNGAKHWKTLTPPEVYAQHDPCCDSSSSSGSGSGQPAEPLGTVLEVDNGPGLDLLFETTFEDLTHGIEMVEVLVHTDEGLPVALTMDHFSPPLTTVTVSTPLPSHYASGALVIKATCMNAAGATRSQVFYVGTAPDGAPPILDQRIDAASGKRELIATGLKPGHSIGFYTYVPQYLGDLDFDLDVDADDELRFHSIDWSQATDLDNMHGDVNGNGVADDNDLAIIQSQLGSSEAGAFPVAGCPGLTVGVPSLTAYFAVADANGRATVLTNIVAGTVPRVRFGAVDMTDCVEIGSSYILQR